MDFFISSYFEGYTFYWETVKQRANFCDNRGAMGIEPVNFCSWAPRTTVYEDYWVLMVKLAGVLISASKSAVRVVWEEGGGAGKSWSRRHTVCVLLRSSGVARWTATVTVLRHVLRGQLCPLGDKEDVARDAPRPQILPLWRRPIVTTGNRTYY